MKKRIRLTESDLHRVIKESVKKVVENSAQNQVQSYLDMLADANLKINMVAFDCPSIPQRLRDDLVDVYQTMKKIMNEIDELGLAELPAYMQPRVQIGLDKDY